MANPQKENGYTAVANEIMDALCKYRIPGESYQVLNCVLRMTYGWNRKEVQISNNQISKITGLKRQNVIRALRWLESKAILSRIKSDSMEAKILKFNKHYDEWEPYQKKNGGIKSDSKTRIKSDSKPTSLPIIVKTNKTIIDEFTIFYQKYPLKKSKKKAEESWLRLSKTKKLPPIETVLTAIENQIKEKELLVKNNRFCPEWKHPSTWLNQECWNDECKLSMTENIQKFDTEAEKKRLASELAAKRLERFKKENFI